MPWDTCAESGSNLAETSGPSPGGAGGRRSHGGGDYYFYYYDDYDHDDYDFSFASSLSSCVGICTRIRTRIRTRICTCERDGDLSVPPMHAITAQQQQ
ncbi:hypothetical protein P8C59_004779 [Phyllachora maydis]|uniref:Uncharacterized protein n=1 Tax=Phyllachora maydis TaxID=1825666 RepID=A0AAD9I436_9PEZI|nr:hypothetical protein P8C59_004779 [Phyllachora maydis]